jgi:hypothetical protein
MFKLIPVQIEPVRAEPVRLPIVAALAVPDDDCIARAAHPFNVPGALYMLLGSAGWARATKVARPLVWAPGWDDARLARFVAQLVPGSKRPFPLNAATEIRAHGLFGQATEGEHQSTREILHILASFDGRTKLEPQLRLSSPDGRDAAYLGVGAFRDALIEHNTRLLILQVVDVSTAHALRFAQEIVGSGGPATIVTAGGTPDGVDRYFVGVYANIVHNMPLSRASRPTASGGAPDVWLVVGRQADGVLQFHRWLDTLQSDLYFLRNAERRMIDDVLGDDVKLLHASQVAELGRRLQERVLSDSSRRLIHDIPRLTEISGKLDFARESKGVIPLSQVAEAAPSLERAASELRAMAARMPNLLAELHDETQRMTRAAPRALNANFVDTRRKTVLGETASLVRGRRYDLLVDVGPRWNRIASIVRGNAAFPEAALPTDERGHRIRVVLFSEDFGSPGTPPESHKPRNISVSKPVADVQGLEVVKLKPPADAGFRPHNRPYQRAVASAEMWLPENGRSHPIADGEVSAQPGPVRLAVVLPRTPKRRRDGSLARGRLSVYHGGNLLQSAVVAVNVYSGRTRRAEVRRNSVEVDYVLSGSFADIGRYEVRELEVGETRKKYPVALNIAMNDAGGAGHRLMFANRRDLTVMRPYDPAANEQALERARANLEECFYARANDGQLKGPRNTWKSGLDANNGKSREQFKSDLWNLAWFGCDLYALAVGQYESRNQIADLQELQQPLSSRTVIQVSRTSPAQYVYPWALVYDIPMPDLNDPNKIHWCPVIDEEWDEGGVRHGPADERCPHDSDTAHVNLICPYGFWGLKHFIEQPINNHASARAKGDGGLLPDVAQEVQCTKPPAMSVGITRDAALDKQALKAHLETIAEVAACSPANGAETWDQVLAMLVQPDIVYFLCHGEFDAQRRAPYLGIGLRDNDYQHRVYSNDLLQWARTQAGFWRGRHPLVFINGCQTARLSPGQILSFVNTFSAFGASAVIGTEVSIRLSMAVEVAERLLDDIAAGHTIGAAIHAIRWHFTNKGNLLGLAYTPYGLSNLTLRTQ